MLSSDDEDGGDVPRHSGPAVQTLVTVEDAVMRGQSSQEAVAKQQEASAIEDMEVSRLCSCFMFNLYLLLHTTYITKKNTLILDIF